MPNRGQIPTGQARQPVRYNPLQGRRAVRPAVAPKPPPEQSGWDNFLEAAIPLVIGAAITGGLTYLLGPAGPAAAKGILGASAATATTAGVGVAGLGTIGAGAVGSAGGGLAATGVQHPVADAIGQPLGARGVPGAPAMAGPARQPQQVFQRQAQGPLSSGASANLRGMAPRRMISQETDKQRGSLVASNAQAILRGFGGG